MPLVLNDLDADLIKKHYARRMQDFIRILEGAFGIRCIVLDDISEDVPLKKFGEVRSKNGWLPVPGTFDVPGQVDFDKIFGDLTAPALARSTAEIIFDDDGGFAENPLGVNREEKIGFALAESAIGITMARLARAATFAVFAADTPVTNQLYTIPYHSAPGPSGNVTRAILNSTRMRVGQRFGELRTLIAHPEVIYDLLEDSESPSDLGKVEWRGDVLYIGEIAVLPLETGMTEDQGGGDPLRFHTILCGHNTLGLAVNLSPTLHIDLTDNEFTIWADFQFALTVFGMAFTGEDTEDATLDLSANWDERYSDPRNLLMAVCASNTSEHPSPPPEEE